MDLAVGVGTRVLPVARARACVCVWVYWLGSPGLKVHVVEFQMKACVPVQAGDCISL